MPAAAGDGLLGEPAAGGGEDAARPAAACEGSFLPAWVSGVPRERLRDFQHHKRVGNYLVGSRKLGEGSFAKVREGLHVLTGEKVAIKVIDKKRAKKDTYVTKNLRREGQIQQMIRHPNITQLLDILETENSYYLVMELCPGGNLMHKIYEQKRLEEPEARRYIRQLVSAVEHLHRAGVVHRDLKIENLLLDEDNNIKLIDFGLSNCAGILGHSDPFSTQCGSPAYAAPELLARKKYGPKIDVWSMSHHLPALAAGARPREEAQHPAGPGEPLAQREFRGQSAVQRRLPQQDLAGRPEPERAAAHDGEAGLQEQRRDQHGARQPRLPHPRHLLPPEQEARALPVGETRHPGQPLPQDPALPGGTVQAQHGALRGLPGRLDAGPGLPCRAGQKAQRTRKKRGLPSPAAAPEAGQAPARAQTAPGLALDAGAGRQGAAEGPQGHQVRLPRQRSLWLPQHFPKKLGLPLRGFFLHGVHCRPAAENPQGGQEGGAPAAGPGQRRCPAPGGPAGARHGPLLRVCGPRRPAGAAVPGPPLRGPGLPGGLGAREPRGARPVPRPAARKPVPSPDPFASHSGLLCS
ncbi:hormonally up-regulated neu tumor-associated kinase isoform 2-T2 [Glossophaga mutica]